MKAKVKRVKVMSGDRPNRKLRRRGAVRFDELTTVLKQADSPLDVALPGTTDREPVKMDVIGSYPKRPVRKVKVDKVGEAICKELDNQLSKDEQFNEYVASGNTCILASL